MSDLVLETMPCCSAPADATTEHDWWVMKHAKEVRYEATDFIRTGFLGMVEEPVGGRIRVVEPATLEKVTIHRWWRKGIEKALWHWTDEDDEPGLAEEVTKRRRVLGEEP